MVLAGTFPLAEIRSLSSFPLEGLDYAVFAAYLALVVVITYFAGRGEQASPDEYFLAGKRLPWYVVGGSFIASNISSEHFIGMIGSAAVFGICIALMDWINAVTFSLLIWFFIPFLLASKVFTIPEFLERRFSPAMRQMFAVVTIVSNVVAFLAAVLYGGGLALQQLFGWNLWFAVIFMGIVAGVSAIYGGLASVAWTDFFIVIVMIAGGIAVTIFGLYELADDNGTLADGLKTLIERNRAQEGVWADAVNRNAQNLAGTDSYNRLSVFQPATHPIVPAVSLLTTIFSVSIWYNVLNQFMIQRVLGAKNMYHARMGIVLAGGIKVLMPLITVVPGMILFAMHPEILMIEPWSEVKPQADRAYVHLLQTLVPAGFRGLFLIALFGAIQSTVNAVLNSTATVFTLDIYRRWIRPQSTDKQLVRVGVISSAAILVIAIALGGMVGTLGGSLFEYIQSLYAFFAPPFAAVFLLGILWRRINAVGATTAVVLGFTFGIAVKLYVNLVPDPPAWLIPYANQAAINWLLCVFVCTLVSLATAPPKADQISDQLTFNWSKLNIFNDLGAHWYTSVITWWLVFFVASIAMLLLFSELVFAAV
jgi:solute:Na+ symporter, SSS family